MKLPSYQEISEELWLGEKTRTFLSIIEETRSSMWNRGYRKIVSGVRRFRSFVGYIRGFLGGSCKCRAPPGGFLVHRGIDKGLSPWSKEDRKLKGEERMPVAGEGLLKFSLSSNEFDRFSTRLGPRYEISGIRGSDSSQPEVVGEYSTPAAPPTISSDDRKKWRQRLSNLSKVFGPESRSFRVVGSLSWIPPHPCPSSFPLVLPSTAIPLLHGFASLPMLVPYLLYPFWFFLWPVRSFSPRRFLGNWIAASNSARYREKEADQYSFVSFTLSSPLSKLYSTSGVPSTFSTLFLGCFVASRASRIVTAYSVLCSFFYRFVSGRFNGFRWW